MDRVVGTYLDLLLLQIAAIREYFDHQIKQYASQLLRKWKGGFRPIISSHLPEVFIAVTIEVK